MNTEKIVREIEVGEIEFSTSTGMEYTIDNLTEWLNEMKKKGATNLNWSGYSSFDSVEDVTCTAFYTEIETDEQLKARIKEQETFKEIEQRNRERVEMREFERLKAKYGQ